MSVREHIDARIAAVVAGLALAMPATAAADSATLSVINEAGAPQSAITAMEQAATLEVNTYESRSWPGTTTIAGWDATPTASDWTISLVPASQWQCTVTQTPALCSFTSGAVVGQCWCSGLHVGSNPPAAYIEWSSGDPSDSEYRFSHETVEMMADPYIENLALEICDPVNGSSGMLLGVEVAAFREPNGNVWFPPAPPQTTTAHTTKKRRIHKRRKHAKGAR